MKPSGNDEVRMTLRGFRQTKKPLSGDVLVVGRSPRHTGVLEPSDAATPASPEGKAASVDRIANNAGGAATTSVASAANRETYAEVADSMSKRAKSTPKTVRRDSKKRCLPEAKRSPRAAKGKPAPKAGSNTKGNPQDTGALWDWRMALGGGPDFPRTGREYVQAVNAKIDLVTLAQIQLKSPDEKLSGRLLEQLLKIAFETVEEAPAETYDRISANVPG